MIRWLYVWLAIRFRAVADAIRSMDRPSRVRGIYSLATIGMLMVLSVFAIALVWILWRGGWPVETATQRVDIFGKGLTIVLGGIVVGGLAILAVGGAIDHLSAKSGLGSIEASRRRKDEDNESIP